MLYPEGRSGITYVNKIVLIRGMEHIKFNPQYIRLLFPGRGKV
jgi:hypothetical protein